jgi:hypothetical protein
MPYPTIFFGEAFLINVVIGWFLTAGGALLIMAGAVWATWAESTVPAQTPKSGPWRGLYALGLVAFVGGWIWQAIGYYRIGVLTFQ